MEQQRALAIGARRLGDGVERGGEGVSGLITATAGTLRGAARRPKGDSRALGCSHCGRVPRCAGVLCLDAGVRGARRPGTCCGAPGARGIQADETRGARPLAVPQGGGLDTPPRSVPLDRPSGEPSSIPRGRRVRDETPRVLGGNTWKAR